MRTLRCEGLTLEPQVAEHAPEMFALLADPAIYEYENEPPQSLVWLRQRFRRLEARVSPDGREQWLNWVVRTPAGLAGYVQATVYPGGQADIAYVLSSAFWGRGIATAAVGTMIAELRDRYGVQSLAATFRVENMRSRRVLERLGFSAASAKELAASDVEEGEGMMKRAIGPAAGYSGTPLARKLGIKEGSRVCPMGAPADYRALLEPLPGGVAFTAKVGATTDLAHVFVTRKAELAKHLAALRKALKPDAALWISWPKKAAKVPTDITEDVIREVALPMGWVDVKVCAVTQVWSGLKLVVRKELRK